MPTPAQRERTEMREKLYACKTRGGGDVCELARVQLWPLYLEIELRAAKPTLTLAGMAVMIEEEQTPAFGKFPQRPLTQPELVTIRAFYDNAAAQQREVLGDAIAAAQANIMGQAAANQAETIDTLREQHTVKEHVSADGEKTRAEVRAGLAPLAQLLGPDDDNATAPNYKLQSTHF